MDRTSALLIVDARADDQLPTPDSRAGVNQTGRVDLRDAGGWSTRRQMHKGGLVATGRNDAMGSQAGEVFDAAGMCPIAWSDLQSSLRRLASTASSEP